MKTLILIALLPAMVGLSQAPRHIIERTPLSESGGQITFVDKYSDGTIDRTSVPQTIKLENKEYSVATNIARVTCIATLRTNTMWRMAYEVRHIDGSIKTNYNFFQIDHKDLQRERKAALTNLLFRAARARSAALARASSEKPSASSQIASEAHRVRTMLPASEVASESVNAKGQLVQRLTNGAVRVKSIPRRASVPIAPAKKAVPPAESSNTGTATATGAAGALVGAAAAAAALKKRK